MATHSNGTSALQFQKQLRIGSYRIAWTPVLDGPLGAYGGGEALGADAG